MHWRLGLRLTLVTCRPSGRLTSAQTGHVHSCVCPCTPLVSIFLLTLFAATNGETSSSRRSDCQDEDAKCEIIYLLRGSKQAPLSLACWDQSNVWAKDMKARDGVWRRWAGGRDTCWCLSLHVRSRVCSFSHLRQGICRKARARRALHLRNEPVANQAGAAGAIPEAAGPPPLQRGRKHGRFKQNSDSGIRSGSKRRTSASQPGLSAPAFAFPSLVVSTSYISVCVTRGTRD